MSTATETHAQEQQQGQTSQQGQSAQRRNSWARVPAAFRLQFAVPSLLAYIPLMVWFFTLLLAVAIGLTIKQAAGGDLDGENIYLTGSAQAPLWTLAFMAAYAASHTFPFSLALSFSRRVFVIGAFLAFGCVSVVFGLLSMAGTLVERATNGYGFDAYVYNAPFLMEGPGSGILPLGLAAALLCQAVMLLGFGSVILYLRLGVAKLWSVLLLVVAVIAGLAILTTFNEGWGSVWEWITQLTVLKAAGWLALVVAVQTVVIYWLIRRATPRG